MGKVHKDFFGQYHVDVTEELARARRNEQFRNDMSDIGQSAQNDMAGAVKGGIGATAAMGVGAVAVGVAASRSLSFRYKLQAVLHFPFAFFVSWVIYLPIALRLFGGHSGTDAESGQATMMILIVCMGLSAVTSIVWSMIYIQKRTKPKLARLRY